MEEKIFDAYVKAQEELKELDTEYFVLQYQLRKLKAMTLEAALYSVDHSYGGSVSWKDIQSIMEWSDIEDAVAAYKASKEAEKNDTV